MAGAPSGRAGALPWRAGHPPVGPVPSRGRPPALPAATAPCSPTATSGKKQAAKSKEELAQEKKKELERRLQDVSGQLSNSKKPAKRGRAAPCCSGQGQGRGSVLWPHRTARRVPQSRLSTPRNPDLLTCGWGPEAEQVAGMWGSATPWSPWEQAFWKGPVAVCGGLDSVTWEGLGSHHAASGGPGPQQ